MALSTCSYNNKDFIASLQGFVQEHLSDIFRDAYAVLLGGSRSLGFIKNPNDLDLIIILNPDISAGPFGAGYINKSHKRLEYIDGYPYYIDFHYRRLNVDDYKHYPNAWMFYFNQLLWIREDINSDLVRRYCTIDLNFLRRNLCTLVPSCLRFLAAEKEGRAPRKQLYYISVSYTHLTLPTN